MLHIAGEVCNAESSVKINIIIVIIIIVIITVIVVIISLLLSTPS